jgi:hypothetical protein
LPWRILQNGAAEGTDHVRIEDGFQVVRTADCADMVKLDQFAGDPLRFGKLPWYARNAFF